MAYGDGTYGDGTYGTPITVVVLAASAAQSAATLALSAPTRIPLAASAAQSAATLTLTAPTQIPLGASVAQSSATLALTVPGAPVIVPLGTAAAVSSATLALTAPTRIPLGAAAAQSAGTLALTVPGVAVVPLAPAAATATPTLALQAQTRIPLGTSTATSSATLVLAVPQNVAAGGKFVLTKAKIVLGGVDISRFCNTVGVNLEADEIDYTPIGSPYRIVEPGLMQGQFKLDLYADQTVITPAFWASLDAPVTITVTPRSDLITAVQNPTWSATAVAVRKTDLTGQAGEAAKASVELHSTGGVLVLTS